VSFKMENVPDVLEELIIISERFYDDFISDMADFRSFIRMNYDNVITGRSILEDMYEKLNWLEELYLGGVFRWMDYAVSELEDLEDEEEGEVIASMSIALDHLNDADEALAEAEIEIDSLSSNFFSILEKEKVKMDEEKQRELSDYIYDFAEKGEAIREYRDNIKGLMNRL